MTYHVSLNGGYCKKSYRRYERERITCPRGIKKGGQGKCGKIHKLDRKPNDLHNVKKCRENGEKKGRKEKEKHQKKDEKSGTEKP